MKTTAAVMRAHNQPLSIETIDVDPPKAGELLLRMAAAGICGSDRHVLEGHFPGEVPTVGGHEGAGVVEAVGEGVQGFAVGDHVLQTFVGACGVCNACRRGQRTFCSLRWTTDGTLPDGTFRMHAADGSPIGTLLGLGSFSAHTVSPARNCVVVPPDVDLACAALVACGVSTGVGAIINVARTQIGDDVGARIAGAGRIIAVDVHDTKEEPARSFGATHFVNARTNDPAAVIAQITEGRGVDRLVLTLDRIFPEHYKLAIDVLAPGGVAVQVGSAAQPMDQLPVSPNAFASRQVSFTGTVYGGMNPEADARRWLELHRRGALPVEKLITREYEIGDINTAFDDLAAGRNIRGLVRFE
jgi:Zn-dependent alcohol dehydrogenase